MKFVHIGDLHLGKVIYQYSLLDIQRKLLFELLEYMNNEDIKILVIAGDVYDRLIPSQEAVNLLDEFLSKALLEYKIKVLMISGNHDSSDRLHFASSILSQNGLYIETYPQKQMKFVEIDDVRFYLLPFMKPSHVKALYHYEDMFNYQEAMNYYMSQQTIDCHYKNVLVTHQFVGHQSIISDSETPLSVGGSEIIDAHLFDCFDYVALGHLHAPQKVSRETMRYSGSLMRYSFDEVKQNKSIVIVNTDDMSCSFHELHPTYQLEKYEGYFEEFMDPTFIEKKDNFLSFIIKDNRLVPHAIEQLRVLYPHLLQITYDFVVKQEQTQNVKTIENIEKIDSLTLFEQFYYDIKKQTLEEQQKEVIQHLLERVGEQSENH